MSRRTWSSCSTGTPFLRVEPNAASRAFLNFFFLACGEKLDVLGIAAGPAAFNVMNPESVELLGDAELVRDREIDAFALRTVAQGRVIDFNLGFHKLPVKTDSNISETGTLANPKKHDVWSFGVPRSRGASRRHTLPPEGGTPNQTPELECL